VTKVCTAEEWQRPDSPLKLSPESKGNEDKFVAYKWYKVRVKPLPEDQVVQEVVEDISLEEMYAQSLQAANSQLPPNLSSPAPS
jgi:uncharacterized protein (DUF1015 family)